MSCVCVCACVACVACVACGLCSQKKEVVRRIFCVTSRDSRFFSFFHLPQTLFGTRERITQYSISRTVVLTLFQIPTVQNVSV